MPTYQRSSANQPSVALWPATELSKTPWQDQTLPPAYPNDLLWPATPVPVARTAYADLSYGVGALPKVMLRTPDGASAEIYLHGAQVTSWKALDGKERLFLSRISPFRDGEAIWGGIPVAFPQFGRFGALPIHGLARLLAWEWLGAQWIDGRMVARFRLDTNAQISRTWPYRFSAELTVQLGSSQLAVTLQVRNTGAESFDFTAGLHTYLAVDELGEVALHGLDGMDYLDACGGLERRQNLPLLNFNSEVNRIYFDAPPTVSLAEPNRMTGIHANGFRDLVVWNPAAARCAGIAELEAEDYQRFVCVEAVMIGTPINLAGGESWQGGQRLIAA